MHQVKDVAIRIQALNGSWETVGVDRARGIVPENVQLTSDQWGSKTASFDLRRDPKVTWPDIGAFAPVEIEIGGLLVWSGRVSETPVRDSLDPVINVQCEGWQAHLDDDIYERIYVHTNLSDYVDARSFTEADLSKSGTAAGQVQAGSGGLVLAFPKGTELTGGVAASAAAVLDLGPNSSAKRVVFDAMAPSRTGTGATFGFHCRASDSPIGVGASSFQDLSAVDITALSTTSASTTAATVTTARRYIVFFLYYSGAGNLTTAEDNTVKITNVQVFADTAYESGNASILKANQVINDALNQATLLLSSDRTGIEAGTFNIPELAPSEPKTPREMWNAVDAFEDRYKKIDVLKRPIYKAKPASPEVEVGAWAETEFEDSSANNGGDIYTGVVMTGTKADGAPLRVTRTQSVATLVSSRGFSKRKQINSSFTLTNAAAEQIGDKWLLSHLTTPFKGRAKLVGNKVCREIRNGRPVAAEELLLRTGELIRFSDRIDPDSGAVGRDGRLVEAQYDVDTDSVNLTIDSSRAGFEALLERLGVVLGQNRFS